MSLTTAKAVASLLNDEDRATLREIFGERVRFDEPLGLYTSWKIGGPADAFAVVEREEELASAMRLCFKRKLPWFVIGSGSNVLVGAGGLRGIVVRLGGASAGMAAVTAKAATLGAVGIGSLAGIPGTVGGSLRMNAGTDREMGEFVRSVWVQSPSKPEPHAITVQYFYRHTTLARDAVVSRVTLAFERGD